MVRFAVLNIKDIIYKLLATVFAFVILCILGNAILNTLSNVEMFKKCIMANIPIYSEEIKNPAIYYIKNLFGKEIYALKNGQYVFNTQRYNTGIEQSLNNVDITNEIVSEDDKQKDIKIGDINLTVSDINDKEYIIGNNVSKIDVKNSTKYQIDFNEMLNEKLNIFKNDKMPTILIIHTHGSETYTGVEYTDYFRNENTALNMIRVGEELANILKNSGYDVIHDTRLYDYPTYSGSYTRALSSIEQYIEENDNTQIVLDIHRDAIASDENFAPSTVIDGNSVSKIMVISGTDQGGLSHPNWKENLKFALQLYNTGEQIYPDLFRNLNITKSRYNQHATNASLILEVGATGNTLDQSILSMRYFAKILDETLRKNWGG